MKTSPFRKRGANQTTIKTKPELMEGGANDEGEEELEAPVKTYRGAMSEY